MAVSHEDGIVSPRVAKAYSGVRPPIVSVGTSAPNVHRRGGLRLQARAPIDAEDSSLMGNYAVSMDGGEFGVLEENAGSL